MAPMTKGSNLPYRRLCVELGAQRHGQRDDARAAAEAAAQQRVRADPPLSRRTVLRRAARRASSPTRRRGRRRWSKRAAPSSSTSTSAARSTTSRARAWAPSSDATRNRIRRLVEAMKRRGHAHPGDGQDPARMERRRSATTCSRRERRSTAAPTRSSCTDARATRATASPPTGTPSARSPRRCPMPVIGNGDLLFPHDIDAARARSGCAAVMVARAALIKPWIFREATERLLGHHRGRARGASIGATRRSHASTGATTNTA